MPTFPGTILSQPALDSLKSWPRPMPLDMHGTLHPDVNINSTGADLVSGSCVHVHSVTAAKPPVAVFKPGANLGQMPIFLWSGTESYDCQNPGVPPGVALGGSGGVSGSPGSGTGPAWVPVFPTGTLWGLVAAGGYELVTTEFDGEQVYAPNDALRAVTSDTNANAGKLTNKGNTGSGSPGYTSSAFIKPPAAASDSVVGIVSRGRFTDSYGRDVLAFWPHLEFGLR